MVLFLYSTNIELIYFKCHIYPVRYNEYYFVLLVYNIYVCIYSSKYAKSYIQPKSYAFDLIFTIIYE